MPLLEVANGEIADKLTILEIKRRHARDSGALENIDKELSIVRNAWAEIDSSNEQAELLASLRGVNLKLWTIEDDIRQMEADKCFDDRFVSLARSVYIENDKRSHLKMKINQRTGSTIFEEKIHPAYEADY